MPAAATLLGAIAAALALGCADGSDARSDAEARAEATPESEATQTPYVWPDGPHPTATLVIADMGEIVIELYPELAPGTVDNFVKLAREGFYDGTSFHRVIPGFMVQGGDPYTRDADRRNDGAGGPGYTIEDEHHAAPHVAGVVSMANKGTENSGGSQFFFVLSEQPHLDGKHTIFGRVRSGAAVVEAIAEVDIDTMGRFGAPDRPITPVVIERVVIEQPALAAAGAPTDG